MWNHLWPNLCCWPCENIHVHSRINGFLGTLDFWLTLVWLDNHFIHVDVKFGPSCLYFLAKLIDKLCIFDELVHLCFERLSISSLVHLAIFNPDQSIVFAFFWFKIQTVLPRNWFHSKLFSPCTGQPTKDTWTHCFDKPSEHNISETCCSQESC